MMAIITWLISTTPGRIVIGAIAFIAWLTFHDISIRKAERAAVNAQAAKEAVARINNLEKNNANFRNLSDRDRCLVFMRDSGLPDSSCQ